MRPWFCFLSVMLVAQGGRAQTTTGAIRGTASDPVTGAPLSMVTVVASSTERQGAVSDLTDGAGRYHLDNILAGTYTVVFIYGGVTLRREPVEVSVGKMTVVNAAIATEASSEVITIKTKSPTIDSGSTKTGASIKQDYLGNVPSRGRTWSGVLGAAAGSQADPGGTSFSGATSIENGYLLDGINTTGVMLGPTFPLQGSQVITNFIQEIEIITGGYNAEFGRATGAVVNVVTKTGTNELHGSLFGNLVAYNAPNEPVHSPGGAISYDQGEPTTIDFGFEVGGPIIRDRLWFYAGVAPLLQRERITRRANRRVDRNILFFDYGASDCRSRNLDGSCNGDAAADPGGLTRPTPGCEREPGPGLGGNSCEGDGQPDLDPATHDVVQEELAHSTALDSRGEYQFTGKLNLAVAPEHQGQVSLTGQYSSSTQVSGGSISLGVGTPTATQLRGAALNTDLGVKWSSKLFDNRTRIEALVGWHRDKIDDSPLTDTIPGDPTRRVRDTARSIYRVPHAAIAQQGSLGAVGRNADVPESDAVLQACTDGDPAIPDLFPAIINCPITSYSLYSTGFYRDALEQRMSGRLAATQRLNVLGSHELKAGLEIESNHVDEEPATGGTNTETPFGAGSSVWQIVRAVELDRGDDVCAYDGDGNPRMCEQLRPGQGAIANDTLNHAAFVQDSWSILPNLTVNAGLRWEQQALRYSDLVRGKTDPVTTESYGENALRLRNLLAPRLGVIYDWTKEGRSRVYASWGRFYESIPLVVNSLSLSGGNSTAVLWDYETQCGGPPSTGQDRTTLRVSSVAENCPTTISRSVDPGGADVGTGTVPLASYLFGGTALVSPDTKAQYVDELTAGIEYELLEDLRAGLSYQGRRIGRVIEDMSSDGGLTYFIGNPGTFSAEAEHDLRDEIAATTDAERRALLIQRLEAFVLSRTVMDRPRRDYNAVSLAATKRFSRAFMVQGSYTWSSLRGNYSGLLVPERGDILPNISQQYDIQEYQANRCCLLALDRPHLFKLDGYYILDLQRAGQVSIGSRFRAQSGSPILTYGGIHPFYGSGQSYLLPRGEMGRTPFLAEVDLHVAYGRKIGPTQLDLRLELFNVFNRQTTTRVDSNFTLVSTDPLVNGENADLDYIKGANQLAQIDKATGFVTLPSRNKTFLDTVTRSAPLSIRVGATLSF